MAVPVDLSRWTPIRVTWDGTGGRVDWCHTEGIAFTEPFFTQTVDRCLRHPFRLLFRDQTGLEELCHAVDESPGLPPAGFVFHMSRCGSTLVTQMLAAAPGHLVLSEPPPVGSVLMAPDSRHTVRWLRAMVGALGQPRDERQRRLFVKFDAWSTLDLPVVRRAFPDVPWLFVFRDPVEVLVSHARRPGAHMIPGVLPPERFGLDATLAPVDYAARVLASICEAALARRDDPLATFVDYETLPDFVLSDLPRLWDLRLDDGDLTAMKAAAHADAKNPCLPFADDRAGKRAEVTDELLSAADRWLAPLHARLLDARVPV